jgi:hypothetical protein
MAALAGVDTPALSSAGIFVDLSATCVRVRPDLYEDKR